jgi:membrane protein YdbS with pleckstrin-like domain
MANATDRGALSAYARSLLAAAIAGLITWAFHVDGFSSFLTVVIAFLVALAVLAVVPRLLQNR